MAITRTTRALLGGALGISLAVLSCATSATQKAGGTPPADPRGVPVGGTAAAYHPDGVPNFYDARSVGAPGSGAFAGSGPGELARHREEVSGQPAPKTVPEIPRAEEAAPVADVPVVQAPSVTTHPGEAAPTPPAPMPVAVPPGVPRPADEPIFQPPGQPQPDH